MASGKPVWKAPARENDKLNVVIMHEKGIIVCPRSTQKPTINLIDYTTGQMVWGKKGKGIKAQGSVVSYLPTERGILLTNISPPGFSRRLRSGTSRQYLDAIVGRIIPSIHGTEVLRYGTSAGRPDRHPGGGSGG